MIKVFNGSEWVEGEPVVGEVYRIYRSETGYIETVKSEDVKPHKIVITSHNKRALLDVGDTLDVTVEFQDYNGNTLPLNDSFAMPVNRVGGVNYKTVKMTFVEGVCNKSIAWPDAGEFEITKAMVNLHLEDELDFDGFNISVME